MSESGKEKDPYKLVYEWGQVTDIQGKPTGKFTTVACDAQNIPPEDHFGGTLAN